MRGGLTVSLMAIIAGASAANILIIVPTPSISHQLPFHTMSRALLERGHRITILTTDSAEIRHMNYTEIDLSVSYSYVRGNIDYVKMADYPPTKSMTLMRDIANGIAEMQLSLPAVQNLLRSGEKFDLVIFERRAFMAYYGLIHKLGSPPVMGAMSLPAPSCIYHSYGNPMNPAYSPELWLGYSDRMNFWQRLHNTYIYLRLLYTWFYQIMPVQNEIMQRHFGPNLPPIYEMERNFSMLIINNHFILEYPRPHLPNIIEITGIHIKTEQKPLPKDVKKFLDDAEHGVIYFSLGTNVLSKNIPEWKRKAFIDVFRELPQRVLWKWENETLDDKPDNLMVRKWLPQQDILAHPNVRLFITQGGLQSLNEATYHAVPLLVIPFFGDQPHNAMKIKQAEIGVWLEYNDVTKEALSRDIRAVLHDSKYKTNMKTLSRTFKEHRADSIERTVWWIEYVIRHKGAPHMRSGALDLYWWQLLLLDVISFVLMIVVVVLVAVYFTVRRVAHTMNNWTLKIKSH